MTMTIQNSMSRRKWCDRRRRARKEAIRLHAQIMVSSGSCERSFLKWSACRYCWSADGQLLFGDLGEERRNYLKHGFRNTTSRNVQVHFRLCCDTWLLVSAHGSAEWQPATTCEFQLGLHQLNMFQVSLDRRREKATSDDRKGWKYEDREMFYRPSNWSQETASCSIMSTCSLFAHIVFSHLHLLPHDHYVFFRCDEFSMYLIDGNHSVFWAYKIRLISKNQRNKTYTR